MEYLTRRGITQKSVTRFRIEETTYQQRPCLKYPTIGRAGGVAYRVKFTDDYKTKGLAKVKWFGETPQADFAYYSPGGLVAAITAANGVLHWASGEPDVWTLHEAGVDNVTCCFGERSIPQSLADDLKGFGVTEVVYWVDLDKTGMESALKFADRLAGSGLKFEARVLDGEIGSKRDLNQMLQDNGNDITAFQAEMERAKHITYSDLKRLVPTRKSEPEFDIVTTNKPRQQSMNIEYSALFDEWIDKVIIALGAPAIREGQVYRWHCPLPSHADKHPSFRIADGDHCKMPICTCGIQTRHDKASDVWDEVARAVGADTWEDYKKRAIIEKRITPTPGGGYTLDTSEPAPVAHTQDEPLFVSSDEAYDAIGNQLAGVGILDMDFVVNPLTVLHEYGGFGKVLFPGKLVYIVGISGGGKTSLAETMGGVMRREGLDFIWYGPEWTPEEMAMRDLQRGGGVPMIRMAEHKIAVLEEQRGVALERRLGEKLPDSVAKQSIQIVNSMLNWRGKAYFTTPLMNRMPLTQMLLSAGLFVDELRGKGRKVSAFFFDYLQRANKTGRDGAFWSEAVAGEIKAFCESKQLVGIVMIQPRKNDSEGVHTGSKQLTEASGQGISDQQCNLYLAVEPIFEGEEQTDFARIKIVKNSMGRTTGREGIIVPTNFARLTWVDTRVRQVNLNA